MVAGGDEHAFRLAVLHKVHDRLESLVVLKNLPNLACRVVDVSSMVNTASLNHEEETLITILGRQLKSAERGSGHLAQTWVYVGHILAVDLKGHIRVGK